VLAFKRYFTYDYILTDTFLLRAHNPYAPEGNLFRESKKEEF